MVANVCDRMFIQNYSRAHTHTLTEGRTLCPGSVLSTLDMKPREGKPTRRAFVHYWGNEMERNGPSESVGTIRTILVFLFSRDWTGAME